MKVEVGSGNVFADLGLPDAADLDTKVRLAVEINQLLSARALSQAAAAELIEISEPEISALENYELDAFSAEWLTSLLLALKSGERLRH